MTAITRKLKVSLTVQSIGFSTVSARQIRILLLPDPARIAFCSPVQRRWKPM